MYIVRSTYIILWGILLIKYGVAVNISALGCHGSKCYSLIHDEMTWNDVSKYCNMLVGGKLASIPDEETNIFLVRKLLPHGSPSPYTGALALNFPWKWVSGETYESPVERSETTIYPYCDPRQCAKVVHNPSKPHGNIIADICSEKKRYVCKRKGVPSTSENLFISLSDDTWYGARYACSLRGMDLLVFSDSTLDGISSLLKQRNEISTTNTTELWIGVYSMTWIWTSSGEEIIYNKFDHGCGATLMLWSSGKWIAYDTCCKAGICESDVLPDGTTGSTANMDPSNKDNNKSGVNLVYQVVIPLVCGIGGCIIVIIIAVIVWKRKRRLEEKKERKKAKAKRQPATTTNEHPSRRYDNPTRAGGDDYLEISENPGYNSLTSPRVDHQYQQIS